MGPSLFLNPFSYTAFPGPSSTCPLHFCKGSWSHLSASKFDHWRFLDRRNSSSGTRSPISRCLGAAQPVKFPHSRAPFPTGGIVRAQLPFLARSREAGVCPECLRAAGAGGRDEVMALAGIQGHSHSAIAASSKATFASSIWESLYCLLMAIKGILVPIFEPGASIYYWFNVSAALDGI